MELKIVLFMLAGALLGLVSDRLAARWPRRRRDGVGDDVAEADAVLPVGEESDPASSVDVERPFPRPVDWRAPTMVVVGALAFGALGARWSEPRDLLVLGIYFATLIVLLATDLDQKLLPDLITFPLMAYALAVLLLGWVPLLDGKSLGLVSGLAAGLGAPVFLFISDRVLGGALGIGDLKLAVSLGLMSGVSGLFAGFLVASALSSVALLALIGIRRIGLRSAIPFGPVLIAAGMIAALLPA